ncbi:MAG: PaaI family thioesterase [Anaerolineae bacterium]|nr:PaaI family thioesterase [Anaerolineae bacterium]
MGDPHGGAIAVVLDEAMGTAAAEQETPGYTVTMTYNYKSHIPLNEEITVRAWIDHTEGRKVFAECEAKLPNGMIAVTGHGIFVQSDILKKHIMENLYIPDEESE